jgi:putative acid phosphatase of HAD superfamily subfamily IIIB
MSHLRSAAARRPSRPPRSRRSLPLVAGALIAAAGLVFGGIATAAGYDGHGHGPSNPTPAPNAAPPRHGDAIPNVTTVESEIKAYYGSVPGTVPGIGAVTLPSPDSNYAREVHGIEAWAKVYLAHRAHHAGPARPALIFDIDDTTLNTYDYEISSQFAYTPASNAAFVNAKAFPAVFGMPALVNWAGSHGYTIFFLTGRPEAQRAPTVGNLTDVGYTVPTDAAHVYLKQPSPPSYLHCAAAPTCTTIEYKSGTRAHIEAQGYRIVADFGDQFSDLKGGHSGLTVKLPNPMYYLP